RRPTPSPSCVAPRCPPWRRSGCTCLWQIGGRNTLGFEEWMRLDLKYIDTWSLGLDFQIMFKTVGTILRGTGY
ncbi:MAG: sugar transferase, partial [Opitutae bacterium]|nr:sugar transferase [Opitutae bacterium]